MFYDNVISQVYDQVFFYFRHSMLILNPHNNNQPEIFFSRPNNISTRFVSPYFILFTPWAINRCFLDSTHGWYSNGSEWGCEAFRSYGTAAVIMLCYCCFYDSLVRGKHRWMFVSYHLRKIYKVLKRGGLKLRYAVWLYRMEKNSFAID